MLRLTEAVDALVPLIEVSSTDPMHDVFVLESLFEDITEFSNVSACNRVGYRYGTYDVDADAKLYTELEAAGKVLIVINADCSVAMECGELKPNKEIIKEMIGHIVKKSELCQIADIFDGLYVKQIKRVMALTSVRHETLSLKNLRSVKESLFFHVVGIQPVSNEVSFYYTDDQRLEEWVQNNKPYMFADVDQRLSPKGILLNGEPGTGKTEFAKYLSREWGIPLFLLDLNSMLTKWQGEAETYLANALATLDDESPCVVLFDEVEKLFSGNSENDTSQRLLSKILWWLQAKESKVFVVMTCNDMDAIPGELYRPGRIDRVEQLHGVPLDNCEAFVKGLLSSFGVPDDLRSKYGKWFKAWMSSEKQQKTKYLTPATLSQSVIGFLQKNQFGIK